MSLIKGIVKYIFILLGLAIGAGVILCAVMMFVPNVSILGYKYISVNQKNEYILHSNPSNQDYVANLDKVTDIEIDAENVNVTVTPLNSRISNKGYFEVFSLIQGNGFAKVPEGITSMQDMYYTFKPEVVALGNGNYKLIVTNKTADGLVNLTHHKLEVFIPIDIATNLENLSIKTKAGDITVEKDNIDSTNDTVICVNDTTILESTSGNQNVRYITINTLNAKSYSGKMIFNKEIGNIKKNAILENEIGSITFGENVNILGSCQLKSGISRIKMNDITDTFEYVGESAYLEVGKVTGKVSIKSTDAIINIEEVSGPGSFITAGFDPDHPNQIGNRSFRINKVDTSTLFLETNTGDIIINELISQDDIEAKPDGNLLTESGNITIGKLVGDVSAVTKSGNIKITQGTYSEYPSNKSTLQNAYIKVQSNKGNVVLKNIVGEMHVNITSGGNSPIEIEMIEVNKNSEINGKNGNMNLSLPMLLTDNSTPNVYSLAFFTQNADKTKNLSKGAITISLSGLSSIGDRSNYYYVQHVEMNPDTKQDEFYGKNAITGKPILTIYSSNGNINIKDIQKTA
ncbi:MAG: hypothetical protein ACI4TX_00360 [Christensenellales bacterium]